MPVWAQNICCSIVGIKMVRERFGRAFREFIAFLEESQTRSLNELKEFQNEKLREIIRHAYETVPYYREVMDERKLTPSDIQTVEDLPKLPILTKQILRSRTDDFLSSAIPRNKMISGKTGGTTGTSLKLFFDRKTSPRHWAIVWRGRRRWGIDIRDAFISLGSLSVIPLDTMKPPFWRRNLPYHQTFVSVHHLTVSNMAAIAEYLCRRKNIKYYSGFPSGWYLIGKYFLENNISLPHPPKVIITGSESLLPHQRSTLSEAFKCPVTDYYGASECCIGISTCEKNNYHHDMEFGATELVDFPDSPERVRKVLCTGFWNRAMPLIRYDIGDLVTQPKDPTASCSCGRASPMVERIDGRTESYILTPDGRRLGRLSFLFKSSTNIEEAQFVQKEISSVTTKVVKGGNYSSQDEQSLLADMRHCMGDEIEINIEYVQEIPREPNGKFRQIISRVVK